MSMCAAGAEDLVRSCCAAGQTWAQQNDHCLDLPPPSVHQASVCRVAQHQCCLSSLRETQCEAGVTAARAGGSCDVEAPCPDDSYQASASHTPAVYDESPHDSYQASASHTPAVYDESPDDSY
ncbi:unnamed protein product [Knipowitschia caucasica]